VAGIVVWLSQFPTFSASWAGLARAGLLGKVSEEGGKFRATWPTSAGDESELFSTIAQAIKFPALICGSRRWAILGSNQ
jgi:hypothetical protein